MNWGDVFAKAWRDYKLNFKTFSWLAFLFTVVPFFVVLGVYAILFGDIRSYLQPESHMAFYYFAMLVVAAISYFGGVALLMVAVSGKRVSFGWAIKQGGKNFFRFIGLYVVVGLALLGLTILLIVPAIIFSIYWVFSPFVFAEKKGIRSAMRESKRLVKGHWWRTLGYLALFTLIVCAVGVVASLISLPFLDFGAIIQSAMAQEKYSAPTLYLLVSKVVSLLVGLFIAPLTLSFYNRLYQESKKEKKN